MPETQKDAVKTAKNSDPKLPVETCPRCEKVPALCFCADIKALDTNHRVLILQHPQEPDKTLGSARIAQLSLTKGELKVGLSWRSHKALLGENAVASEWGVLYLGSGVKGAARAPLTFVDKKGAPADSPSKLKGFIVIDGTWSQAKALWWRNAWLLKLKRIILTPTTPSLYGKMRKEPRKECLSTIETVALTLDALGEAPATGDQLRAHFKTLLSRAQARRQAASESGRNRRTT